MSTKLGFVFLFLVTLTLFINNFTSNLPEHFTGLLNINDGKVSKLK